MSELGFMGLKMSELRFVGFYDFRIAKNGLRAITNGLRAITDRPYILSSFNHTNPNSDYMLKLYVTVSVMP